MTQIFTFGKHKNVPISIVFKKDKQYIQWLCNQKWFRDNHNDLFHGCQALINNYHPMINKDKFIIYTDGSCPNNGTNKARASIGIHFSEKNPIKLGDVSKELHISNPSNNVAELMAIYESLLLVKKNNINIPIQLYTDSSYCRSILLEWYETWIKTNTLKDKKNIDLIKKTHSIYKTIKDINIFYVKGHSKNTDEHSHGNRIADRLARSIFKNVPIV